MLESIKENKELFNPKTRCHSLMAATIGQLEDEEDNDDESRRPGTERRDAPEGGWVRGGWRDGGGWDGRERGGAGEGGSSSTTSKMPKSK